MTWFDDGERLVWGHPQAVADFLFFEAVGRRRAFMQREEDAVIDIVEQEQEQERAGELVWVHALKRVRLLGRRLEYHFVYDGTERQVWQVHVLEDGVEEEVGARRTLVEAEALAAAHAEALLERVAGGAA